MSRRAIEGTSAMRYAVLSAMISALIGFGAEAAQLRGSVQDKNGAVENAVVYATPLAGLPKLTASQTMIDQINKVVLV